MNVFNLFLLVFDLFLHYLWIARFQKDFCHFFNDKRYRPRKYIHKVWKNVGVGSVVKLLYVDFLTFELYDGAFVIVDIAVVWS